MNDYLIWWTSQEDCERITPLDIWPVYIYNEFRSRYGRAGRGRLWVPSDLVGIGESVPDEAKWDEGNSFCKMAEDAGGIVIRTSDAPAVMCLPGFLTTFDMTYPELNIQMRSGGSDG